MLNDSGFLQFQTGVFFSIWRCPGLNLGPSAHKASLLPLSCGNSPAISLVDLFTTCPKSNFNLAKEKHNQSSHQKPDIAWLWICVMGLQKSRKHWCFLLTYPTVFPLLKPIQRLHMLENKTNLGPHKAERETGLWFTIHSSELTNVKTWISVWEWPRAIAGQTGTHSHIQLGKSTWEGSRGSIESSDHDAQIIMLMIFCLFVFQIQWKSRQEGASRETVAKSNVYCTVHWVVTSL